jgi:methionine synthase I (cobalamin-dependent)
MFIFLLTNESVPMDLLTKAKTEGLLFDGAFGSLLMQRGLPQGANPELWCLEHPEVVTQIHADYLDAGADVVTANTFGASPLKLQKNGLRERTKEINFQMVALAQKVIQPGQFVAADIGPTGEMLQPFGLLSRAATVANYAEQAQYLVASGIDFFIIETMFDLNEALAALEGIRQVSNLPVFASMTFEKKASGFVTVMGNRAADAMRQLQAAGATAVGANCSLGSVQMISLAQEIRQAVDCLVVIQPNAGLPILDHGQLHYPETPETFADNLLKIKSLGVEIIGGCCGTTPEYIHLIRQRLNAK